MTDNAVFSYPNAKAPQIWTILVSSFFLILLMIDVGQLNTIWRIWAESYEVAFYFILPTFCLLTFRVLLDVKDTERYLHWSNWGGFLPSFLQIASFAFLYFDWVAFITTVVATIVAIIFTIKFPKTSERENILHWSIAAILWLTLFVGFEYYPVGWGRVLGSPAIVIIFLGLLLLTGVLVFRTGPWAILSIIIFLIGFVFNGLDHSIEKRTLEGSVQRGIKDHHAFTKWFVSRGDLAWYAHRNRPYPVFVVSSEGGGGYASAHAYSVLSGLQQNCPNFGQHIFALVGVSGGAVGNTHFHNDLLTAEGNSKNPSAHKGCGNKINVDTSFDETDHLAPLIGTLLFSELPKKGLWLDIFTNDRARSLASSFSDGLSDGDYSKHFWKYTEPSPDLGEITGAPALVNLATDVSTGHLYPVAPFILNNFLEGQFALDFRKEYNADISTFDSAIASAAFAYFTPSLRLTGNTEEGQVERLLVDGGYSDNTGTLAANLITRSLLDQFVHSKPDNYTKMNFTSDEFEQIKQIIPKFVGEGDYDNTNCKIRFQSEWLARVEWTECTFHFSITHIVIRSQHHKKEIDEINNNFVFDPIKTLYRARQGRSIQEVDSLVHTLCQWSECTGHPVSTFQSDRDKRFRLLANHRLMLQSIVYPDQLQLPLGWMMPREVINDLARYIEGSLIFAPDPEDPHKGMHNCTWCELRDGVNELLTSAQF